MTPFHGLVIFQHDAVGGWRVFDQVPFDNALRPAPLREFTVCHPAGHRLLGICGTFRRALRRGAWCKRPHKEIIHA
jgi:hypothetical protein